MKTSDTMILLVILLCGCAGKSIQAVRADPAPPTTSHASRPTPAELVVVCRDYDGQTVQSAEQAVIFVNDQLVGIGRVGLRNAIGEVRKLPRGSKFILKSSAPAGKNRANGYWNLDDALEMRELLEWIAEDHGVTIDRRFEGQH